MSNSKTIIRLKGDWDSRKVWVNGKPLNQTSPAGFNWSSNPGKLAFWVLVEFLPAGTVFLVYPDFKRSIIKNLPKRDFEMDIDITEYIEMGKEIYNRRKAYN